MFNVYPYSAAYGIVEEILTANRVNSRARINNEPYRKDTPAMQAPLIVLDAHIQAVNTNRLQQARHAKLVRLARQDQPTVITRVIAAFRRTSGRTLVSIGQRLQNVPATDTIGAIDAMSATQSRSIAS